MTSQEGGPADAAPVSLVSTGILGPRMGCEIARFARAQGAVMSGHPEKRAGRDHLNLLLVEDDPQTAAHIVQGLAELGHSVDLCDSGSEAVQRMIEQRQDVVILDRMLPEIDGVNVVTAMRRAGIHLSMLMLTALGSIEDRVEGLEARADDYLVKPFEFLPDPTVNLGAGLILSGPGPFSNLVGAGLQRPLAAAIIFGLSAGMRLVLLFLPALLCVVTRARSSGPPLVHSLAHG